MLARALALTLVAALCLGAAPARKAATAAFDARSPASLVALLAELDAKAEMSAPEEGGVQVKVVSPAGSFQAQYAGCDRQGRGCQAVQFDAAAAQRKAALAEINSFNQTSIACRIYQDAAGKPHMVYSGLLFSGLGRQDMLTHLAAWRGCLADFDAFLRDPPAFLANAP